MVSEALAAVVDVAALGLVAILCAQYVFNRYIERGSLPTASNKSNVNEKRLRLIEKLRGKPRLGPDGKPLKLTLREHELEVASDVISPSEIDVTFADIGGLQDIARQLQRHVLLPVTHPELFRQSKLLRPPKGILLHGPPGTGKTLLARAIAKEASVTFIALNPARLLSKWFGESNKLAMAYFTLAAKLSPSILFIDEIDCLFRSRGHEHEATAMIKSQFLSLWDGLLTAPASQHVIVVAATNKPADVDPAVLRRLPLSFQVDLPTAAGREDVLRLLLRDEPLAAGVDLRALAAATDGYSGSDLDQLCKTAAMRALDELLAADAADAEAAAAEATQATQADARLEVRHQASSSRAEGQSVADRRLQSETQTNTPCGASYGGGAVCLLSPAAGAPLSAQDGAAAPNEAVEPSMCSVRRGASEAGERVTGPRLQLRPLTLDDFLRARDVVRPTRGRFVGVHHEVGAAAPLASTFDEDLYD
jgi:SpoVK/Ycf46/Vps4 family AAA+-type ATPase